MMKRIGRAKKRSMEAKWPFILAFSLSAILAADLAVKYWASERVIEWVRLGFGAMAAVIMLFLSLFSVRRIVLSRKLGAMEAWRKSHLYLGTFCVVLILLHTNFKVYGGFGVIMISLFFLVTFSGVLGELMYRTIPVWLSKQGADALELDQKRKSPAHYLTAADEAAEKASEEFKVFYGSRIRRLFAAEVSHLGYLMMNHDEIIQRRRKIFVSLAAETPPTDKIALKSLEALFKERDSIEFKYSRLQAMRWWSTAHAPATAALIAALALHLWSIIYY